MTRMSKVLQSGTLITYTLTDNGELDTDPTEGAITDPVTIIGVIPVPLYLIGCWLYWRRYLQPSG